MKYVGRLVASDGFLLASSELRTPDQAVAFSFLIDPEDGVIADAAFHARGPWKLLQEAENVCRFAMRKRLHELERYETDPFLHEALKLAAHSLGPERHVTEPSPNFEGDGWEGFENLSTQEKIAVIEQVLDVEIRPFVAMDGGGVKLINLLGNEVVIAYEGNCTSCFASTGSTLSAIQQMLQAKVHKDLVVVPQLDQFMTE